MATTVAHGLIGISTYCAMVSALPMPIRLPIGTKALLLAALAANLPDFDMLVSLLLLSDHKPLHGGITHSFAFAGSMAVLVWLLILRRCEGAGRIAFISFILVSSHVVVDWFTGPRWGLYPSHGLAAFWPVSDNPIRMSVTLFKGVMHRNLLPGAIYTALWELILLGPMTVILIVIAIKINRNRQLISEEISNGRIKTYR